MKLILKITVIATFLISMIGCYSTNEGTQTKPFNNQNTTEQLLADAGTHELNQLNSLSGKNQQFLKENIPILKRYLSDPTFMDKIHTAKFYVKEFGNEDIKWIYSNSKQEIENKNGINNVVIQTLNNN